MRAVPTPRAAVVSSALWLTVLGPLEVSLAHGATGAQDSPDSQEVTGAAGTGSSAEPPAQADSCGKALETARAAMGKDRQTTVLQFQDCSAKQCPEQIRATCSAQLKTVCLSVLGEPGGVTPRVLWRCRVAIQTAAHEQERQGRLVEAERHYRSALEARPDTATAAFNLGVVLEDMKRTSEAVDEYRRAIRIDPRHADAHYNLAGLYQAMG